MKKLSLILCATFCLCAFVASAQNVGIGTTNPQAKLDVVGNVKITDGTEGEGKVLTSNATGTATWRNNNSSGNTGFGPWGDCTTSGYLNDFQPMTNEDANSGDSYGVRVAISGDYAIVGAYNDDEAGFTDNGSATIYKRNNLSGIWEQQVKLINPSPASNDNFGLSVSINGDYAIVGAPFDDEAGFTNNGSVSIYKRNTVTDIWEYQIKLFNTTLVTNDLFGQSVSINGDYIIVGAPLDDELGFTNNGSASIYKRNTVTGIWEHQIKLLNQNLVDSENFGVSVSINNGYAIVSSYEDEAGLLSVGSASIYKRNTTTGVWDHQIKLFDTNRTSDDYFGVSVSINGDYAIVGSLLDDENGLTNIGSASIYKRNTTTGIWALQIKLLNTNPTNDDNFGNSVCISGDYAVIGAYLDDEAGGTDNGSVTMYKRIGNVWTKIIKNTNPLTTNNENFGSSVAIDGSNKRFLVGASGAQANAGMAFFGKAAF